METGKIGKIEVLDIDAIDIEGRYRDPTDEAVDRMVSSMKDIGLRTPITVRHFPNRASYVLVAGAHRLAAAKRLGWTEIGCFVAEEDDVDAELWEIDENLIRAQLTAADEAIVIGQRKRIYEKLHPETKKGGDKKSRAAKAKKSKSHDETSITPAFIDDTAAKTGKSRATVARAARRDKKIGTDNLAKIKGTSLDKHAELDALTDLPAEQQAPIIEAAVNGENVTARNKPPKPKPDKNANKADTSKAAAAEPAWIEGDQDRRELKALNERVQGFYDLWLSSGSSSDKFADYALRFESEGILAFDELASAARFLADIRDKWTFKRNEERARAVEPVGEQPELPMH